MASIGMAQSMSAKAAVGSSIHRWLMKTNDNSIMAYINGAQYGMASASGGWRKRRKRKKIASKISAHRK
jgi:hypothetical protein